MMTNPEDYAKANTVDRDVIPVIDLSERHDASSRAQLAAQIVATAERSGFFYVSNHGVSKALRDQAFAASRRFFALDPEDKASIQVDQNQRGWMAQGLTNLEGAKTHDAKEVFFWGYDVAADDADVLAGLPLVVPNQWPDAVASFLKQDLLPYYHAVLDLGRDIMALLAQGLGQSPDFFRAAYEKPLGRGQLVYYPAMDAADRMAQRFGAAAHTDFGVLTILMQDDLGGLQIQSKDGDWIEAPPIADTFVCNIGDLLQMWTNGRLTSTLHRVINRSPKARFSIPVFCDPASATVINPQDFDASASADLSTTAGAYIVGKNRKNFNHYKT
jgi:isopenicillin N synthase-like dioxygenase